MVAPEWVVQHPTLPESKMLPVAPMGSFYRRIGIANAHHAVLALAHRDAGRHPPRTQVSGGLIPEDREASGFDDRSLGHDASTEVQGSSPF